MLRSSRWWHRRMSPPLKTISRATMPAHGMSKPGISPSGIANLLAIERGTRLPARALQPQLTCWLGLEWELTRRVEALAAVSADPRANRLRQLRGREYLLAVRRWVAEQRPEQL